MRTSASPFFAGAAGELRRIPRSGSRYSACSDEVSKTDSRLLVGRLGLAATSERGVLGRASSARRRPGTPPRRRQAARRARRGSVRRQRSSPPSASRPRPSRTRGGRPCPPANDVPGAAQDRAGRGAADEERAADEAVRCRRSPRRSRRSGGERAADARARGAAARRGRAASSGRGSRRRGRGGTGGRRAGRCARACSPPTATSASGSTYAAPPSTRVEPVREPRADGAAVEAEVEDGGRKRPSAASPSPRARWCCDARGARVRFLTREGTRGRSGRFFLPTARHAARFAARAGALLAASSGRSRARAGFDDDALGVRAVAVGEGLDLRHFQVLVDLEEVLDLVPQLCRDVCTSLTRIHAVPFNGTQMIFSSGPFSSRMWKTPTMRPRMRQPGNVGSPTSTSASSGSPSPPIVPSMKP